MAAREATKGDKETKGDRDSPCRSPQLGSRDVSLSLPFPLTQSRRMMGSLRSLSHYRVSHLLANLGWVDTDLRCSTNLHGQ